MNRAGGLGLPWRKCEPREEKQWTMANKGSGEKGKHWICFGRIGKQGWWKESKENTPVTCQALRRATGGTRSKKKEKQI